MICGMVSSLNVVVLEGAKKYLLTISDDERGLIARDIESLRMNETEHVDIKQLRRKIRELRSGPHRLSYFERKQTLYFVRGFRKKSTKTPKREIEYAEKIYALLESV